MALAVNAQPPSSAPAMYTFRVYMLSPRASGRRTASAQDRSARRRRPATAPVLSPPPTSSEGPCVSHLLLQRDKGSLFATDNTQCMKNPLAKHQEGIDAARTATGDSSLKLLDRYYRNGTREKARVSQPKSVCPFWMTC